jgi:hypothetical protein
LVSLLEINRWWANELSEEEKVEIFHSHNSDSVTDDYFEWWYYLEDLEKIKIYKEQSKG